MSCVADTLNTGWLTVSAVTTLAVFFPAGEWQDAGGITSGKAFGESRGRNGNCSALPAIQLANDVRSPIGNPTVIGATVTVDGMFDPNGNTAIATGSAKYLRPGYLVSNSAGTVLSTMNINGIFQLLSGV